ncbi:PucR family transcriptional regulator [Nonomuraea cavernae]|uniref:PucR family transcriptional regulator n=1 Tax=Nonomuraea cavernae TaxID=2045107 RepID=UPI00166468A2|nr:PucR family transcriptional regulator ligand-binding domain-containing protein [Nonomuraea cavernae]MCA2187162.1 PucR family transcriptional regulator ligand-binding domain-containing protein [Nonomuraea cavernae]
MYLHELVATEGLGLRFALRPGRPVPVSWVHSTDMADPSAYLGGGELILTIGLWRQAEGDAERFVEALHRAGAAALGYGVEAPGADVPADVLDACRSIGLPLVRVPHEVPFIEVARAFHAAANAERHDLRRLVRQHEALAAAVASGGMPELVRVLAAQLAGDVWVVDGPEVVWASPAAPPGAAAATWRRGHQAAAFPVQAALADSTAVTVMRVDMPVDEVTPARCFLGYARPVAAMTAAERRVLDNALPHLRGELVRLRERRGHAASRRRERLALAESGRPAGPPLAGPAPAVLVFAYPAVPGPVADSLLDAVPPAARDGGAAEVAVIPDVRESVVILRPGAAVGDQTVACLLRRVEDQLDREVHAGWTLARDGESDLPRAVTAARHAARLAATGAGRERVARYERLGTHEVLLALDEEIVGGFQDLVLGPLVEYDSRHGSQLVETLMEFLDRNCAYQASAEALGIHVNTLRYRLLTIEQVTGRDLRRMADKVDFYLALRSRRAPEDPAGG